MQDNSPTTPWPMAEPPPPPPPFRDTRSAALSIGLTVSLTANVMLLACLLGMFLLARAGAFAPANSAARSAAGPSPTVSLGGPGATPSPTLAANWLQVTPSSVQLGCAGDQQTQSATLTNSGPQDVQWQIDLGAPAPQAGIDVSPKQGNLKAGASTTIQIQVKDHANDQQGIIYFNPTPPMAGPAPSLSYTITGCQGG
jgi:hypothetical protein